MHNFFISNSNFTDDKAIIIGEDVNHIKNVLRMDVGTKIYTTNNDSHVKYLSEIISISSEEVENESKQTLKDVLSNLEKEQIKNVAIIVGPEGGVDNKEIESFVSSGAKCVSLGKRILRTETAPVTILSMLVYEFEL